ncbi:MAG: AraC family transcriptional regulator [Chitinophagaceae bacterium]|nr:AraC family transcriptional regulator [Chitinophagaceae bacterium]
MEAQTGKNDAGGKILPGSRTLPTQLAKACKPILPLLSMVINKGFSMNFNDWVNKYRLEEVKSLFEKGEHKKQTLLSIAFECGFNSKATFNRAFKKATGITPREWLSRQ